MATMTRAVRPADAEIRLRPRRDEVDDRSDHLAEVRPHVLLLVLGAVFGLTAAAHAQVTVTTFGSPGFGPGEFAAIGSIDVDDAGNVYVMDDHDQSTGGAPRVQVFDPDYNFAREIDVGAIGGPGLGLSVAESEGRIYVGRSDRVQWFDLASGAFIGEMTTAGGTLGNFSSVQGLDHDAANEALWVTDTGNDRVLRCLPDAGSCSLMHSGGLPAGVAVDAFGNAYVALRLDHQVRQIDPNGSTLRVFGAMGSGPGSFNQPNHPSVAGAVYVADAINRRIQVHDLNGLYIDEYDPGFDGVPFGTAVDKQGRVFVAENVRGVVFVITFDRDGDGLFDKWEDGTALIGPDLSAIGVHPDRKDVLVEVDCMFSDPNGNGYSVTDPADHSHCPLQTAMADVVQAFADAPVANPDGTTGIQLHLDVGPIYGAGAVTTVNGAGGVTGSYGDFGRGGSQIDEATNLVIDWEGAAGATSFYDLKTANFDLARRGVFRYALFGHQTNARRPANDCTSGWAEGFGGDDFMVTLGGQGTSGFNCWGSDPNGFSVGSRTEQAGTFLHELGHVMGLGHGGDSGVNAKPNYLSVMNYVFQDCSVPRSPVGGTLPGGCDFSRIALGQSTAARSRPHLDELGLDECFGIDGNTLGYGRMDWDGDGTFTGLSCVPPDVGGVNVTADINGDNVCIDDNRTGTLSSSPSGDDFIGPTGLRILDGPNRTCESSVTGTDQLLRSSGHVQPRFLDGFDDWSNLLYNFRAVAEYADGVTAAVLPIEADSQALAEAKDALAMRLQPLLSITHMLPAGSRPGELVTLDVMVDNTGAGPALDAVLVGPSSTAALGAIGAGEALNQPLDVLLPADSCQPQTTVEVQYADMAGNPLTHVATSTGSNLACHDAGLLQFGGVASGAGLGSGLGFVGVEGLFDAGARLNFATLSVRLTRVLDENGSDLVAGLPVELNVATHFLNSSALLIGSGPGGAPVVELGLQRLLFDRYGFELGMVGATIATPQQCVGPLDQATVKLVFVLDDGINDAVVVTSERPWICAGPILIAL
jgi:hypothetical protein